MSTTKYNRSELLRQLNILVPRVGQSNTLLAGAIAQRLGISTMDFECLGLLEEQGPMTAGQLARWIGLSTGGLTGLVDRLVHMGFAHRQTDENDRRKVVISACMDSATGQKVCDFYRPLQHALDKALADMTDDQLHALLQFNQAIAEAILEATQSLSKAT